MIEKSYPTIILAGCPNAGKSALFNRLTGSRQKVANYPGVTVEYKEGTTHTANGNPVRIIDLPGTYSLRAHSPDEVVARDVILGRLPSVGIADLIICVADATNLKLHLRFALELKSLGIPMILAVNMVDIAERRGFKIDCAALSKTLGITVVPTVAVRRGQIEGLLEAIDTTLASGHKKPETVCATIPTNNEMRDLHRQTLVHLDQAGVAYGLPAVTSFAIDRLLLHPVAGLAILVGLMFLVFQAVFSWSAWPMDQIDAGVMWVAEWVNATLPDGYLKSLLADGIIAGIGSVVIFLPQILVLFFFILILEDSGYMARAAFLLDRMMGGVGLHGRAFIPLLSSFACAIPGIMATRTIKAEHDRLLTILIAPLMTCSARIPVYTLIIAAFIPDRAVGWFNLQGLVMFGLYAAGLISGLIVAYILKRLTFQNVMDSFVMELPSYKIPTWRNIVFGLLERTKIFLRRAGTTIFIIMVIIWILSTFPEQPIEKSYAGIIGQFLAPLFAPIGFNWQMVIALIPGMAAREVAVAVLGAVYAISDANLESSLAETLRNAWSLPTALSFLAWYIFAPQCIATLAVIKRETSRKTMWISFFYLTALAYVAALATYHIASAVLS
ncbi:MAG: ferrous iron transport protein B [Alphaproteobacteria bacterium]|nr:ferrous iron transport protein B [Alphaproteobacteria bacterium]